MYKVVLLSLALICLMIGSAAADQVDIGVDVVVAKPFVATAGQAADFGTIYPGNTDQTVTMIVGALDVATGSSAAAAQGAAFSKTSQVVRVQQGTNTKTYNGTQAVVVPGFAIINPQLTGLDLTATFVSGTLAQSGYGNTGTLPVIGTSNNIAKYATAVESSTTNVYAVAFGPVITLPATAEGTYTGSMTIDIVLK